MGWKSNCLHIDVTVPAGETLVIDAARKLNGVRIHNGLTSMLPVGVAGQFCNIRSIQRLDLYKRSVLDFLIELQRFALKSSLFLSFKYVDKVHHSWKEYGYTEVSLQNVRPICSDRFYRYLDLKHHESYRILHHLERTDLLLSNMERSKLEKIKRPGIYIVYRGCEPFPRYVGKSKNVKSRLSTHLVIKELSAKYDDLEVSVHTFGGGDKNVNKEDFESHLDLFERLISDECCCPYHDNGQRFYRDIYWALYEFVMYDKPLRENMYIPE
ncbi:hypothetical protein [Vibrio paracholerae]|uniref:hypothetical protein n=1 Tax=Vibrio paracholerae TaxID=650003 RepID=UPI001B37E821|nr:hypothetical protein [Vibrio paracholerae]MBP8547699.1 hypothetical protein [Vibrio paracholerae]